ncbi:armadillo-type protein [Cladochytrium replicatum]|nr:armadillo-type protein [Cladochytrium replicatum]
MDENVQQLFNALQASFTNTDDQTRKQADAYLQNFKQLDNCLQVLTQIIRSPDVPDTVKQSGSILFKNHVRSGWRVREQSMIPVSANDKVAIRGSILETIQAVNKPLIRTNLLLALRAIISCDYITDGPNRDDTPVDGEFKSVLSAIASYMANTNGDVVNTGLLCLYQLIAVTHIGARFDSHFPEIVGLTFPILLHIGGALISMEDEQPLDMLRIVFKTFYNGIKDITATYMKQNLVHWGQLLLAMISKIPPASLKSTGVTPDESIEVSQHPYWKAKKWAYRAVERLFNLFGSASKPTPPTQPQNDGTVDPARLMASYQEKVRKYEHQAVQWQESQQFVQEFLPNIVHVYLTQMNLFANGQFMSERVQECMASFLADCVRFKVAWGQYKQHLQTMIVKYIFPTLCYTEADAELWEDDPLEYIHTKYDYQETSRSPSNAVGYLLMEIVHRRFKSTFASVMEFIFGILDQYNAAPLEQKDIRMKDGALAMLGELAEEIADNRSPIGKEIEARILIPHVLPDLNSPHKILRARACDTLKKFADIQGFQFSNNEILQATFLTIQERMRDPELPVCIAASTCMEVMVLFDNARPLVQASISQIMQTVLELTNKIEMTVLTDIMKLLVENFASEIAPFAVEFANQLSQSYIRMMREVDASAGDSDVYEKVDAATEVLKALITLLYGLTADGTTHLTEETKVLFLNVETAVLPAIQYTLEEQKDDAYECIFEILELFTFTLKAVTPNNRAMLPLVIRAAREGNYDTDFSDIFPTLDNYLVYGKEIFLEDQTGSFIPAYIEIIKEVCVRPPPEQPLGEHKLNAVSLMESMLLNLRSAIDQYVETFIKIGLQMLSEDYNPREDGSYSPTIVRYMEVVINALYYNAGLTLQILVNMNAAQQFFEAWLKHLNMFVRVHDKKLSIVAMVEILGISPDTLPPLVQSIWNDLFKGCIFLFQSYPAAVRERALLKAQEDEDDDDDEYGSSLFINGGAVPSAPDGDEDGDLDGPNDDFSQLFAGFDDDDDDDFEEELTTEDLYSESVLDGIDAFERFRQLWQHFHGIPVVLDLARKVAESDPQVATGIESVIASNEQQFVLEGQQQAQQQAHTKAQQKHQA